MGQRWHRIEQMCHHPGTSGKPSQSRLGVSIGVAQRHCYASGGQARNCLESMWTFGSQRDHQQTSIGREK